MKTDRKRGVLWTVVAVAFVLAVGGCSKPIQMASQLPDQELAIDANDSEWHNWFYEKEKTGTKAAVCNDADFVYVCFTTQDEDILMQMVQDGFIIWFNSKGNKDKELGVNFPFVSRGEPGGPGGAPPEGGGAPPGGGRDSNSVSVAELKMLTSEDDDGTILSLEDARALGITARIASDPKSGKLVYELKMPLKKGDNRPYVVQASAENVVGVGLMTNVEKGSRVSGISGFGGDMSDMSSGGSMGGGGGGMGGGMGGGGGFDSSAAGGFSTRDMAGMRKIYDFFGSSEDVSTMTDEDVSVINAQGGGAPPGGGMSGGMDDMGGGTSDMGGGMGAYQSSFEIWAAVTLSVN